MAAGGDERPERAKAAAIYGRTSTPKQASIPQQVELCRRKCDSLGHQVRYVLKEEGQSSKKRDRPMLQRLLQLAQEHRIDLIVIWKLDRLVRSLQDLMNLHEFLEEHRVRLVSVTEQFDTSNSFGRFNFRNIASAAELERDLIAERSSLGRFTMAQAGKWPGNNAPYGYILDDDHKLAVDKAESPMVSLIYNWYDQGLPMTEISRRLGERGVTTKHGRSISANVVGNILSNPLYRGHLVVMEIEHDRPDLAIVPEKLWTRVQERRKRGNRGSDASERRKTAFDALYDDYVEYLRNLDDEAEEEEGDDRSARVEDG